MSVWTIMFYMNADHEDYNDEKLGTKVLNELTAIGSSENLNLMILIDRFKDENSSDNSRFFPSIYKAEKDRKITLATRPLKIIRIENMGRKEVLEEFMKICQNEYTAEKYILVVWDHGGGYRTEGHLIAENESHVEESINIVRKSRVRRDVYKSDIFIPLRRKAFERDEEAFILPEDGYLYPSEIAKVVEATIGKLEFVIFDACWMANLEAIYGLKQVAKYIVASENTLLNDGIEYAPFLSAIKSDSVGSVQLCRIITQTTFKRLENDPCATISAVKLEKLDVFTELLNSFCNILITRLNNTKYFEIIFLSRMRCMNFYYDADPFVGLDVIDVKHFFEKIREYLDDESYEVCRSKLVKPVENILECLENDIIVSSVSGVVAKDEDERRRCWGSMGLTIFFPEDPFYFQYYRNSGEWYFNRATSRHPFCKQQWKEFLVTYFAAEEKIYGVHIRNRD